MNPISWRNADGDRSRRDRAARRRKVEANLRCEALETRQLLTTRTLVAGMSDWATPATWSPAGVPTNGDTLILPAGGVSAQNNNLPSDTQLNLRLDGSGYSITGSRIALSGPTAVVSNANSLGENDLSTDITLPTGSATVAVNGDTILRTTGTEASFGTLTLTGVGAVGNSGEFSPATIVLNNGGFTDLGSSGPIVVNGGVAVVNGISGGVTLNGGTLQGIGTTGSITATPGGGTLFPGDAPGPINTGTLSLTPATHVAIGIDGTAAFSSFNVTGNVILNGAALNVSLNSIPGPADSYTIINNDSTDPIQGTFAGLPQGATLTVPNPGGAGSTQFKINYFGGDGNDATLNVNGPPVAVDDFYSLPESSGNPTFFVPAPGVLTNDSDPNGDTIHPVLVTGPVHGTLVLNGDGSFSYSPAPGFTGPDSFTYRDSDGSLLSNLATVSLAVNAVNEAPVANDDSYSVTGSLPGSPTTTVIAAPGVLANDFSPETPPLPLTAELVSGAGHGTVALNPDGSFSYTPTVSYVGPDTFTYRDRDSNGLGSNVATVTLNVGVNEVAPVANNDAFSTFGDKPLSVVGPGVLANDTDANNGDTLTSFLVGAPQHGTLNLSGDGSFTYVPDPNFSGTDTFTYRATDGQMESNVATVTITVNPVNHPPVAVADNYTAAEETPLVVPGSQGVLVNDSDPDPGDTLTAIIVNNPQHGTLVADANGDGGFTYTPDPLFRGTDTFTYRASDGKGGFSAITPVTISVTPINHAPVAVNDAFGISENSTLNVSAPGVVTNDSDPDLDPISAVLLTGPSHGSVTLNSDGSFTYTPTKYYFGADSFTYRDSDGKLFSNTATVNLTVNFANSPPVGVADTYTTPEESALTVPASNGVLANDSDPDNPLAGQTLTAQVVNQPLHGTLALAANGSFTYTPAPLFRGTDAFTYQVNDGAGGLSAITPVSIEVTPINHAPTVVDSAFVTNENITLGVSAPGVLYQANDVDNDPLSSVLLNGPSHGVVALQTNGAFLYQPNAFYSGPDSFTYRAFDGKTFSNVGTANITVAFTPTPPTAGNDAYTLAGDNRLTVAAPGILGNDFDIDGKVLTPIVVNATQDGTLVVNPNGSFVYTPNPQFSGVDSFTYRASDGVNQSNLATVTINVTPGIATTVHLDPNSDSGVSNTDRITNVNNPTFLGTAAPNLRVVLYAQGPGASSPSIVGVGTADSSGNYSVTSIPLADGTYQFSVDAVHADGLSTGRVAAGSLTIDTVAPVVTGVTLNPKTGQIYVTYTDDRVGLANSTTTDVANYSFLRKTTTTPKGDQIMSARLLSGASATSPETVVLTSASGRRTPHGRYLFRIISGGVADVAGNALDGEFSGTYPSGNKVPGGDFNGEFLNGGTFRRMPIPFNDFIPVVSAKGATPAGPTVHAKAKAPARATAHIASVTAGSHPFGKGR